VAALKQALSWNHVTYRDSPESLGFFALPEVLVPAGLGPLGKPHLVDPTGRSAGVKSLRAL